MQRDLLCTTYVCGDPRSHTDGVDADVPSWGHSPPPPPWRAWCRLQGDGAFPACPRWALCPDQHGTERGPRWDERWGSGSHHSWCHVLPSPVRRSWVRFICILVPERALKPKSRK